MKDIIDFLHHLVRNNNREWFEVHKQEYKAVQEEYNAFVAKLIAGIAEFDPTVSNLTVKDCVYRIYRDVRFSKNKDPYKTHIGSYVSRGGKNAGYGGYYFHIGVPESDLLPGCVLASGVYCASPEVLRSIRDGIVNNSQEFLSTLNNADGFALMDEGNKLKRVPKGFASDTPMAEYLKFKDYSVGKNFSPEVLLSSNALDYVVGEFRKTAPFIRFINRQIEEAQ